MSALATDPITQEKLDQGTGDDKDCIICRCKIFMSFCGKYFPNANLLDEPWDLNDPRICPDCRVVAAPLVCPYCGTSIYG